jgi:glyoxalase family protein
LKNGVSLLLSQELKGVVKGLHHITLVTSNQEVNRRFYTEVLGLRRVKLSVNQDDIFHRHLFYADDRGTTGSAITFFEWPDLPRGQIGLGSPHHLAYTAPSVDSLGKWISWLRLQGVSVVGPFVRDDRVSVYLRDPDGVIVEITSPNKDSVSADYLKENFLPNVDGITTDMKLVRFNHATPITTDSELAGRFYDKFLGLNNSFTKPNPDEEGTFIAAMGNDLEPDFMRYILSDQASDGFVGKGNIHHIAMAVDDDSDQLKIKRRLDVAGFSNSGIIDRFWFHSLYFRDPDGNLLEIATKGPGYAVDEPQDKLGQRLIVPPWLEAQRKEIEAALNLTDSKNKVSWPPKYSPAFSPPESIVLANEVG